MRYRTVLITVLMLSTAAHGASRFYISSSDVDSLRGETANVTSKSNLQGLISGVKVNTCPSSNNFLTVRVTPGTGYSKNLTVEIDTNFDNVTDTTQSFLGVSAVCEDGFIKCSGALSAATCNFVPVSFSGWRFTEGTPTTYKTGCSCIRDDCRLSRDSILQTAGGFFASFYMKQGIDVANGTIDSAAMVIAYRGKDTNCGDVDTLKSYYSSPSSLSTAGDSVKTGATTVKVGNVDMWDNFTASASSKVPPTFDCSIKAEINPATTNKVEGCSSITTSIAGELYCKLGESSSVSPETLRRAVSYNLGAVTLKGNQDLVVYLVRDDGDTKNNYRYIKVYKNGIQVGNFVRTDEIYGNGVIWKVKVYSNPDMKDETGNFSFEYYAVDSGTGTWKGHIEIYKRMTYSTQELDVRLDNSCTSVPSDCRLESEKYCDYTGGDCFDTVKSGMKLSISHAPSCMNLNLATGENWNICSTGTNIYGTSNFGNDVTVAAPWWQVYRIYVCNSTSSSSSLSMPSLDFSYDNGTGNVATPMGTINGTEVAIDGCEKYCRVERTEEEKETVSSGTKEITVQEIRKCENNVCPVNPGERLVQPCMCSENMGTDTKSLSIIMMMDEATKDMICSSEAP